MPDNYTCYSIRGDRITIDKIKNWCTIYLSCKSFYRSFPVSLSQREIQRDSQTICSVRFSDYYRY
jgi:hypothetical protein